MINVWNNQKRQKNILTSFWVRAAHNSLSKFTTSFYSTFSRSKCGNHLFLNFLCEKFTNGPLVEFQNIFALFRIPWHFFTTFCRRQVRINLIFSLRSHEVRFTIFKFGHLRSVWHFLRAANPERQIVKNDCAEFHVVLNVQSIANGIECFAGKTSQGAVWTSKGGSIDRVVSIGLFWFSYVLQWIV